jgi:hypothetical protein
MNSDPLLVGIGSAFPNQNSSTAPTVWEEDTDQAAQQGIPCGSGPMLTLTKRSSDQTFLPGGEVNPCPEMAPVCLVVENLRMNPGVSQQLSGSIVAAGLVGGQFIGGVPGANGLGVVGVGFPGDGVRGVASAPVGATPQGHGVAGVTFSPSVGHAGVNGDASLGGVGVLGTSLSGSGIGVRGTGSSQAVRADGGTFGVVGRGTATAVDGRGVGGGTFGVVGVGGVAGVWGGNSASGGIGVVGVPGPSFVSGGLTFTPWAGRFDGSVQVNGRLFVNGALFVTGSPKSSVVPHPDGSQRVLHAVEAPECWFEDVGRAQLRQGAARIEVDPDFAAVSGIGDDYHVFVTPEGPSNGLYVSERGPRGFEVREQNEGTSEISFSYRIMTKRADVKAGRLERLDPQTEAAEAAPAEPPERPGAPSPASPDETEGGPSARSLAEGAVPGPPSDWPESVPWPPDIMVEREAR